MRKKVIDPAHLLVILNQQEAEVFGLNTRMGWGSPPCRLAMARLFAAASEGTDFVLGHGQITIRAVQSEDGRLVLLFSSVFPSKGKMPGERKLFRIKNQPGPYIYSFSSCEDVMKVLERLCTIRRNGCTGRIRLILWKNSSYRLVFPFPLRSTVRGILTEYGKLCGKGQAAAAYTLEHGKLLSRDAGKELGEKLTGQNR